MTRLEERIREAAALRKPRGWSIRERNQGPETCQGRVVLETRTIYVPPLDCVNSLFVLYHECGHIHLEHFYHELPTWTEEYEAERWAIAAIRTDGFRVSRELLQDCRDNVLGRLRAEFAAGKLDFSLDKSDISALKFADPVGWRRWI